MQRTPSSASMEPSARRSDREVTVAVAVGLVFVFAARFAGYSLLADDAFISFRCADQLARRGELVYNPGERVEAVSNLGYTLLLAAATALGVSPPSAAVAVGFLSGSATVLGVAYAARRWFGASPIVCAALGATVALSPSFAFWAGAGLETASYAALLLALWLVAERAARRPRWALWAGLLAGLAALTRPEGLLAVPLVLLLLRARGVRGSALVRAIVVAAALPVAALGARLAYYGAPLPNPVIAKSSITAATLLRGLVYVGDALRDDALYLMLPAIALGSLRSPVHRVALAGTAAGAGLAILAGGDGLYRARLLAPYLPFLTLAAASGAQRLWQRGGHWRLAALAGPLATSLVPLGSAGFFRGHSLADVREWEERWSAVGEALAPYRSPRALLATNVAGRLPYRSGWRTLDLLGLTDPVIARTPITDAGRGYAGHERAAPAYVLERAPDVLYVSVLDGLPPEAFANRQIVGSVIANGSLYRYSPLFTAPELWARYAPVSLPLRDGSTANVLVRRDGALAALVSRQPKTPSFPAASERGLE